MIFSKFPIRRFRFTLRSLLIVLTAFGIWLGWEYGGIRRRQKAVQVIESFGGFVDYDHRKSNAGYRRDARPPGPKWLRRILGEHYAANAVEVQLFHRSTSGRSGQSRPASEFTDADAAHIAALTELDWLVLMDTGITDDALKHFVGLTKLGRLDLEGTRVTRAGVERLHELLPQVRIYFDDDDGGPGAIGPTSGMEGRK